MTGSSTSRPTTVPSIRLLDWLPLVYAQIEAVEDAAVTAAAPQTFRVGATDLPAYRLTIEVT
jgi:hypothetical protein